MQFLLEGLSDWTFFILLYQIRFGEKILYIHIIPRLDVAIFLSQRYVGGL